MKYVLLGIGAYCIYKIIKIAIRDIKKKFFFMSCDTKTFERRMMEILEQAAFDATDIPKNFELNADSQERFMEIMRTIVLSDVVEELYQDGIISLAGKYIWEEKDDERTIRRDDDSF